MTPSIEQVNLGIPWITIQSAMNVAFQEDASNWKFDLVEAKGTVPQHLTVTPKAHDETAKAVRPLYLVFASRIPMPSGGTRLVYFIWVPTKLKGSQKLEDAGHAILEAVADLYDVALKVALHWKELEIDRQLTQAFYEPDFSEPEPDYDIGDSAFDTTAADNSVGDGGTDANGATETNGNQGEGDGFVDYKGF